MAPANDGHKPDDGKKRLTSDSLRQHESQTKSDKSRLLEGFISSQKSYRGFYLSEGRKAQESWKQPSPAGSLVGKPTTGPVPDAGFSTPVLKPRKPRPRSASGSEPDEATHSLKKSRRSPTPVDRARPEPSRDAKQGKKQDPRKRDSSPAPGVYKAKRTQKTLDECMLTAKTSKRSAPTKRARTPDRDPEREACRCASLADERRS